MKGKKKELTEEEKARLPKLKKNGGGKGGTSANLDANNANLDHFEKDAMPKELEGILTIEGYELAPFELVEKL